MSGRVEGKVAIVIGAARGIGRAIADRLLEIKADLGLEPHDITACRCGVAAWRQPSDVF